MRAPQLILAGLTLLLTALAGGCGTSPSASPEVAPAPPPALPPVSAMAIEGDETYGALVTEALALLREKAPDDYAFVIAHIRLIRQNDRSGTNVEVGPCIVDLSMKVVGASPTWCASAIAHEAYHNKQYWSHAARHGLPVPPEVYTQTAAEQECNRYQLGVLRRLGAPASEIEHLESQTGGHWDADGDGKYDEEDYRLRDY